MNNYALSPPFKAEEEAAVHARRKKKEDSRERDGGRGRDELKSRLIDID